MTCPRCRRLHLQGKVSRCAFQQSRAMSFDNHGCATLDALRDLVWSFSDWRPLHGAVDTHSHEQTLVTLPLDIDDLEVDFLVLGWYKQRGNIEVALAVCGTDVHKLRLGEAEMILEHFGVYR